MGIALGLKWPANTAGLYIFLWTVGSLCYNFSIVKCSIRSSISFGVWNDNQASNLTCCFCGYFSIQKMLFAIDFGIKRFNREP